MGLFPSQRLGAKARRKYLRRKAARAEAGRRFGVNWFDWEAHRIYDMLTKKSRRFWAHEFGR